MYKNKEGVEKARRKTHELQKRALRKSMIAIEEESRRLAKGKLLSDEMVKRGKLSIVDMQMQKFIQQNLRGVIGHLGNITGAIVARKEELSLQAKEGGGVADVLARHSAKTIDDHSERKRLRAHSVSQNRADQGARP